MNKLERLKFSVNINPSKKEIPNLPDDTDVAFLPMEAVSTKGKVKPVTRSLCEVSQGYTYFRDGDVVMAKITPCFENGKGAVIQKLLNGFGFGSTEFVVFRPQNIDTKYLYYIISSNHFRKTGKMEMRGSAGQQRVPETFISNYLIEKISISEQKKRVNFLDEKTVLIDVVIKKKQKQIELLKEKRAALIAQSVTKGLNPNVKMKDSGDEWIGEIPEEWKMLKLKQLTNHPFQYGLNESAIENISGDPRYIRITDIDADGGLRNSSIKTMSKVKAKGYFLKDGDMLFARSGATAGKSFIYKERYGASCFAGYLIRFMPDRRKLLPDYINFITQSTYYENWKDSIFIQSTIPNISADKYKGFLVPVPSVDEQEEIVTYLNQNTEIIDMTISKIQKSIKLIQEYRSSLISHAVTGKIVV